MSDISDIQVNKPVIANASAAVSVTLRNDEVLSPTQTAVYLDMVVYFDA